MTDQEIIAALEQHRLQRSAAEMQNLMASAMFGAGPTAIEQRSKPTITEILAEEAKNRQQDSDQQLILDILLDL